MKKFFVQLSVLLLTACKISAAYWRVDKFGRLIEISNYQRYIGSNVKHEDDYDTDTEEKIYTLRMDEKNSFFIDSPLSCKAEGLPHFINIGNSCGIDSILQVLLMSNFSSFYDSYETQQIPQGNVAFKGEEFKELLKKIISDFYSSSMYSLNSPLVKIPKPFFAIIQKIINGDVQHNGRNETMVDASELLLIFGNFITSKEQKDFYYWRFENEITLANGKESRVEDTEFIMRIPCNKVVDFGAAVKGRLHTIEDVVLDNENTKKKSTPKHFPQMQIFQTQRRRHCYQRQPKRKNIISLRSIAIPLVLTPPFNSRLAFAVCYDSITHHYFTIAIQNGGTEFILYDDSKPFPYNLTEDFAMDLIQRKSFLLFYMTNPEYSKFSPDYNPTITPLPEQGSKQQIPFNYKPLKSSFSNPSNLSKIDTPNFYRYPPRENSHESDKKEVSSLSNYSNFDHSGRYGNPINYQGLSSFFSKENVEKSHQSYTDLFEKYDHYYRKREEKKIRNIYENYNMHNDFVPILDQTHNSNNHYPQENDEDDVLFQIAIGESLLHHNPNN